MKLAFRVNGMGQGILAIGVMIKRKKEAREAALSLLPRSFGLPCQSCFSSS
jgi:hypothetical protein